MNTNYSTRLTGIIFFLFVCLLPEQGLTAWKLEFSLEAPEQENPMKHPSALYIDHDSARYYIADSGNNRLLSFDKDGLFLHSFTAGGELDLPFDMIKDRKGLLYILEKGKNSLTRINLKNRDVLPQTFSDKGRVVAPHRLAQLNELFLVLNKNDGQILALDEGLNIIKKFSCSDCQQGFVDFVVHQGDIWALSQSDLSIYRFSGQGALKKKINLNQRMQFPVSLEVDDDGRIYVLDRHAACIAVFTSNGRYVHSFLSSGHTPGKLYYPIEIRFDPWGRLCVVDEGNGRVGVFSK